MSSSERTTWEQFIDEQRSELARKASQVDDTQARVQLVPSRTTVLSVMKHAAFVERVWFGSRVAGIDRAELGLPDNVDDSFLLEPGDTIESVRTDFLNACHQSREIAAEHDLDDMFSSRRGPVSLRWIYGHLIAEHARHAGHLDILVEQLLADPS